MKDIGKTRKVYHGNVKILSDQGKMIISGRGIFFDDEKVVYATFQSEVMTPYRIERGYHILFVMDNRQKVMLSMDGYNSYVDGFWLSGSSSQEFNFDSYVECKTEEQAEALLIKGIYGVNVYLRGTHSECVAKFSTDFSEINVKSVGKRREIFNKVFEDGVQIKAKNTFGYIGREMQIESTLLVSISSKKPVELKQYEQIVKSVELYWSFYHEDIQFSILRLEVVTEETNNKKRETFAVVVPDRFYKALQVPHKLLVDKIVLNMDSLHKIVNMCTGSDKKQRKMEYGFSQYLNYIRSKTIKINVAILLTAAALDSITSAIATRDKYSTVKKAKFKQEILRIQKLLDKHKKLFSDEIYEFYCQAEPDAILQSLTRINRKDALNDVVKRLSIEDSIGVEAAHRILKARDNIIHGEEAYKIDDEIEAFICRNTLSRDDRGAYLFGTDFGHIHNANTLIKNIGASYFRKTDG